MISSFDMLLEQLAARFGAHSSVLAVAYAGSRTAGVADTRSDVDLYVYDEHGEMPLEVRRAIAGELADSSKRVEIGNTTWEPGDEWIHAATGTPVDIMFRSPQWIAEQLDRVIERHQASTGYSTCFWYNVLDAQVLFERDGWYTTLRQRASVPYPEPLRRAIVAKNHPILRNSISSYRKQIALAVDRRDRVSIQHRTTALLASYFDILFAINRQPHPGEKRLLACIDRLCLLRPPMVAERIEKLLTSTAAPWESIDVLADIDALVDDLDALLEAEGLFNR